MLLAFIVLIFTKKIAEINVNKALALKTGRFTGLDSCGSFKSKKI